MRATASTAGQGSGSARVGLAVATAVVIGLAGCAQPLVGQPAPRPEHSSVAPTQSTPTAGASATPQPRTRPDPAECRAGEAVALGFGVVDSALGKRYLTVEARNCGPSAVPLPARASIEAVGPAGALPVDWQFQPPMTPLSLAPGDSAYLHLAWPSSGRCERGAHTLTVTLAQVRATVSDCFQLGGLEDVMGEQATGRAVWSHDRSSTL